MIEDNEDVRRTTQRLLQLWGYACAGAEDGPRGVERALAMRPAVALVDVGLPGLDGYEVARQIRAVLGRTVHLVALTGWGDDDDRDRATSAGFDLHLLKPVHPDKLAQALTRLIGNDHGRA